MKHNRMISRLAAAALALVLLAGACPMALGAQEGSVSIGTMEELTAFARRCTSDAYSRGLTVTLTADIDAAGAAVSVPVFLGSFDGQGHRITGLRLTESNSGYGLFSRVEEGAVVRNLTVEGEIDPSGSQSRVGGIAGENAGTIENCRFSGLVMGTGSVGGIAGSSTGTVSGCAVSGMVRGTQYTGGVVGHNSGTILRCRSAAAVNTVITEEDITAAELESLENRLYSILKQEEVTESAVTSDTGGIAGYSTGVIQSCTNTGAVGYPHVGYNVGGIAGRQNGYLASCVNRGGVQGRKDVGGIVGQMAPDITLQFSETGLDEFRRELNTLQSLINRTLDDAQSASDTVSGRVSRISGYADSARDSAYALTGQLGDFVDSNVDTANNLLLIVERYIDKAAPILDDLSASVGSMEESAAAMRILLDTIDGTLVYNDQALAQLQSFCKELKAACADLVTAADALSAALALIKEGPAMPDTTQLRADARALLSALVTLNGTIETAIEEYQNTGSVSAETRAQLENDLRTAFECYAAVVADLDDIVNNNDLDGLRKENEETLRQILTLLETAAEAFRSASSHIGAAMGHLQAALGTLRQLNAWLDVILNQMDAVLEAAERAASQAAGALSQMADWARDLAAEDPGSFTPLGPEFDEESSALNASLTGIGNELSALNGELSNSNTALLADLRHVNSQFMKVMNLFLNVLNSTQDVDYTDIYEDVSEESLQSADRGKVLESTNFGAVTADRNAGGIAGAMAIEYDADPEDDLLTAENRTLRFTYQTKAILLSCQNYGAVQAKKSCAGGVTGRMDLGTVSGCGGWGDVSSESGDYVGGVAGLSLSSLRGSYAKCTLSGGKYVGGIAGSGSRVSDCLSMVEISGSTQLSGTVAGEITGEYSANRFVSDTLAGVDRVSLSGKADAISYQELTQIENVPENFLRLTLSFVADGKTLQEQTFDYGASFDGDIYPAAPERSGCYVRWDKTDLSCLHFDTVVTAVYEPYVTTLPSGLTSRTGRPLVLAEGLFREGESLDALRSESGAPELADAVEVWTLAIPEDGQTSRTVRWLIPEDGEGDYEAYVDAGSGWTAAESETVGSYLCFTLAGSSRFAVVRSQQSTLWVWAAAAAGAAAVMILVIMLAIRARRRKRARAAA